MADSGVDVAEGGLSARVGTAFRQQFHHPVGICRPASEHEGGVLAAEGSFEGETAGKQSQADRAAEFAAVAAAGAYIQHGGEAPAIFHRDAALVEVGSADDFRVEGGHYSEHVARIVYCRFIEEYEVLEEVCPLSARVVVNQVSMKMENERITKLIRDLKTVIQ